jgi:thiol-disulfide isomerase/thioredoxin
MNTTGLLVAATVLVLGTALGLWRRRTDGRLRAVDASPGSGSGGAPPAQRPRSSGGDASSDGTVTGERIDAGLLATLGVQPAPATLLQFSTAFCAPCRAVRRISSEVADMVPGVQHVEIDAESHLDAVRTLGIWRTPTLLVLDGDGRIVRRATGVPGKPQLIAVLGDILPTA